MADQTPLPKPPENQPSAVAARGVGPGGQPVGVPGIIVIAIYLIGAVLFCLYGLVVLWPTPTPSRTQAPGESKSSAAPAAIATTAAQTVTPTATTAANQESQKENAHQAESGPSVISAFGTTFLIEDEVRLLLIVSLSGALGSLVHALRSTYWYVGNRDFVWSWVGKYLMQPFAGTALAVVFYMVVRGGFFSPQAGFKQTSPFGFAALAGMVGMFSEQAVLKLKQVAETVLAKPDPGKDARPQESSNQ